MHWFGQAANRFNTNPRVTQHVSRDKLDKKLKEHANKVLKKHKNAKDEKGNKLPAPKVTLNRTTVLEAQFIFKNVLTDYYNYVKEKAASANPVSGASIMHKIETYWEEDKCGDRPIQNHKALYKGRARTTAGNVLYECQEKVYFYTRANLIRFVDQSMRVQYNDALRNLEDRLLMMQNKTDRCKRGCRLAISKIIYEVLPTICIPDTGGFFLINSRTTQRAGGTVCSQYSPSQGGTWPNNDFLYTTIFNRC